MAHQSVAFVGMGGAGKTTLAAEIARASDTRAAFPDGILWIHAGHGAKPTAVQERVLEQLTEKITPVSTMADGQHRLAKRLMDKAVLLAIDDVWDSDILVALKVIRERGGLLFTTRDRGIAESIGAAQHEVAQLESDQALALLADWTGTTFDLLPPQADLLCTRVGYLALGVAIVGGMIKARGDHRQRWQDVWHRLERADIKAIAARYAPDGYQHPSVLASIVLSLDDLAPESQDRYRELAAFAGRGSFPLAAVNALWEPAGYTADDAAHLLFQFVDRCLVQDDHSDRFILHDLEFDVAAHQLAARPRGVADAHKRLLDGYRSRIRRPWPSGPDDGYLLQNLAFHLAHAGCGDELSELLTSFAWMERKLDVVGITDLLADYSQEEPRPVPVDVVHAALQLSAHVLADDPNMLAGQLIGRLLGNPEPVVRSLVDTAYPSTARAWLCPRTPGSLGEPGGPLERILQGHDGRITSVAVSADGKHIVSGSSDKTVKVWELANGHLQRTIEAHDREVSAIAVSADGQRIVSGGFDDTTRVWILASGRRERTLSNHSGHVYAVAVTADSEHIVVGGSDRSVQIWNRADGRLEARLPEHRSYIKAVAVSADDRYIVSGSNDGTVRVWDFDTLDVLHSLRGPARGVEAVAISGDGSFVVSGNFDGTVRIWDLADTAAERVLKGHVGRVHAVAVTVDGKRIVSAGQDRIIRVWDAGRGSMERELQGHTSQIYSVAISADDRRIVSGDHDRTIRVWDLADHVNSRPQSQVGHISTLAFTANGERLLRAGYGQPVSVWDLTTGVVTNPLRHHTGSIDTAVVTDAGRCFVCAGYDQPLSVWDLTTGRCMHTLEHYGGSVNSVAATADGRYMITGSSDKMVRVWVQEDNGHWNSKHVLKGHNSEVYAVAVTSDGRRIISGGYDKIVRVWNFDSGDLEHTLQGHEDRINAVTTTPDGRFAVSGSHDETVRVWDLAAACPMHVLRGHTGPINAVAVTTDGQHLISGGSDRTLRLWDLQSGVELALWVTDTTTVTACATHPTDPTIVACGDESGRVAILSVRQSRPQP
ncbi:hypothetical protein GCM10027167_10600 [Nocardia heshunensis]